MNTKSVVKSEHKICMNFLDPISHLKLMKGSVTFPLSELQGGKGSTLMTSHIEKEAGRGYSLDSEAEGAGVFKSHRG